MKKWIKKLHSELGVAALVAVMFFSILLVSASQSITFSMLGELRQASNIDYSVRAYYAAQAGVEDKIYDYASGETVPTATPDYTACSKKIFSNLSQEPALASEVKCLETEGVTNQLEGRIDKEEVIHLDLSPNVTSNLTSIELYWNRQSGASPDPDPSASGGNPYPGCNSTPQANDEAYRYAAVMEYRLVSWKTTPYQVDPPAGGFARPLESCSDGRGNNIDQDPIDNSNYDFKLTVPITAGNNYIFRFKPKYVGTNYRVVVKNAGGPVAINSPYIKIDSTGQTGGNYRRLVYNYKRSGAALSIFDYVLFSDTDICKLTEITQSGDNSVDVPAGDCE